MTGSCQVAASIPATSDLPQPNNAKERKAGMEGRGEIVRGQSADKVSSRPWRQKSHAGRLQGPIPSSSQGRWPWLWGQWCHSSKVPPMPGASAAPGSLAFIRGWLMARKIGQGRC